MSSVGFPQSNGRAEVAVKTAKRLLVSNTGPTGGLDHDRFLRAVLQLRNTPDPDCKLSPAQIVFGRPLRDSFTFVNRLEKFSNPHIRPLWRQAWAAKEEALRTRMSRTTESLRCHSRPLRPLAIGETVFLQNLQGPSPNKWDRSGVVVESPGYDQYRIRVDGSGRLTLRNRRFLRAYTPATPYARPQPAALLPPSSDDVKETHSGGLVQQSPAVSHRPGHPLDAGWDASLSDPGVGLSPEPGLCGVPTPADVGPAAASPAPPPSLPESPRLSRVRKPPRRYEPESGRWVDD